MFIVGSFLLTYELKKELIPIHVPVPFLLLFIVPMQPVKLSVSLRFQKAVLA